MEFTVYALEVIETGNLLSFEVYTYADYFSDYVQFELTKDGPNPEKIWHTNSYRQAELVRTTDNKYSRYDYSIPKNPFKADELQVVELKVYQ